MREARVAKHRFALRLMRGGWLVAGLLGLASAARASSEIPIEDFFRESEFGDVQISPAGDYVASTYPFKKQRGLMVIRVADGTVTARIDVGEGRRVPQYWWVNRNRLALTIAERLDWLDVPVPTGELLGVDADGTHATYLFGLRGGGSSDLDSRREGDTRAFASVRTLTPLMQEPGSAVIEVVRWYGRHSAATDLFKIDVYNGTRQRQDSIPFSGEMTYVLDGTGTARYAVGEDLSEHDLTYVRPQGEAEWRALPSAGLRGARIEPLLLSSDARTAFLRSDEGGDHYCLVSNDIVTRERHKLACDDTFDVHSAVYSFDQSTPIAAYYDGDRPTIRPTATPHPDQAKLVEIAKSFPDKVVYPVSGSYDGSKTVVLAFSDRDPGSYYLIDTHTLKATLIGAQRSWIDPATMGERRPITLKARDGQTLHGFITLPPGAAPKNLPMIVLPHGGPFGIADSWAWSAEPQLFASRGYAVLQVNFRGSSGYGDAFTEAGRQAWDTSLIDDISDATRWSIAQGFSDPARICIYGGSYGAYAAVMSAIREPDLYRCVGAYAGVYDLAKLAEEGDVSETRAGRMFLEQFVGATPSRLKTASPITQIEKLKAPVFIAHGEDDSRAPFSQAKALRKALDHAHLPYEWLAKADEGHGFHRLEDQVELYQKLLAFFEKNLVVATVPLGSPPSTSIANPKP